MDAKQEIIDAINNRRVLAVDYTSQKSGRKRRLFYPALIGETTANNVLLVFGQQVKGGSGDHPASYKVEEIHNLIVLDYDVPEDFPETYEVKEDKWAKVHAAIEPPKADG